MPSALVALGCAWVVWCALHSLLAWPPLVAVVTGWLGRSYRLCYNLFAVISLGPVAFLYVSAAGPPLLVWPDSLRPLLWVARALALGLVVAGARVYAMADFLGVSQLRAGHAAPPRVLAAAGILGYVRHPWYLAGLLLLWSRDLAARDLLTAVLLSGYLWLGAVLEERRLAVEFGDAYRRYCAAVPRFWPRWPRRR
jgi:protein-S-isoprenylcysteine O-methyltransferase Ste14